MRHWLRRLWVRLVARERCRHPLAPGAGRRIVRELALGTRYPIARQPVPGERTDLAFLTAESLPDSHALGNVRWEQALNVTSAVSAFGPAIHAALQAGSMVRVMGPASLIQGIGSGSMALVETSSGATLVVRSVETGHVAGHLRVASPGVARLAGPIILFQAMSFVTGQYYFRRIERRLATIQRTLDRMERRQKHAMLGGVHALVVELQRLQQDYVASPGAWVRHESRLFHVRFELERRLAQSRLDTDHFLARIQSLVGNPNSSSQRRAFQEMREDFPHHVEDLSLNLSLYAVKVGVEGMAERLGLRQGAREGRVAGERLDHARRSARSQCLRVSDAISALGSLGDNLSEVRRGPLESLFNRRLKKDVLALAADVRALGDPRGSDDGDSGAQECVLVQVDDHVYAFGPDEIGPQRSAS